MSLIPVYLFVKMIVFRKDRIQLQAKNDLYKNLVSPKPFHFVLLLDVLKPLQVILKPM